MFVGVYDGVYMVQCVCGVCVWWGLEMCGVGVCGVYVYGCVWWGVCGGVCVWCGVRGVYRSTVTSGHQHGERCHLCPDGPHWSQGAQEQLLVETLPPLFGLPKDEKIQHPCK